jgi:hypothetical protein
MGSVSILSYLHYLHDVNRKLLQRGGMENVLYRKSSRQSPYYHQLDQPSVSRQKHFLEALKYLQNSDARGIALRPLAGFGLIVGQGDSSCGKKRIAAPLMFGSAQLSEREENPNEILFEVVWDSVALNYDLLTYFLGQTSGDSEDDSDIPKAGAGISGSTLAILAEIEKEIEKFAGDRYPIDRFNSHFLSQTMKYIHDAIPEFRQVFLLSTPYIHRDLEKNIKRSPPVFYPHHFFFIAPAVGELTTMTALAELIRQTERGRNDAF